MLRVASISHYWKNHREGGDRVILVKVELGRTSRKYLYKYGSSGQILSNNLVILLFLF